MNKVTIEITVDQLNQIISCLDQNTKQLINNIVQQVQPQIAQQQQPSSNE